MSRSTPAPLAARIAGGVIGVSFGGIGLAVLAFMWGFLGDDFPAPPLFFRLFASFIALPFVAIGAAGILAAFSGKAWAPANAGIASEATAGSSSKAGGLGQPHYQCPQCSSPLADRADVSPHGDAKCGHCGSWFNVHGR